MVSLAAELQLLVAPLQRAARGDEDILQLGQRERLEALGVRHRNVDAADAFDGRVQVVKGCERARDEMAQNGASMEPSRDEQGGQIS